MKHKKLQKLFCQFTDEVAFILEDELRENSQLTRDYLAYPHSNSPRSPTSTNYQNPAYFNPMNHFSRAKQHIALL